MEVATGDRTALTRFSEWMVILASLFVIATPLLPATARTEDAGPIMVGGAAVLLIGALIAALRSKSVSTPNALLVFVAFVGWAALSAFFSAVPFRSEQRLATWLAALGPCLVFGVLATSRRQFRGVMSAMVAGATMLALYGWALAWREAAEKEWQGGFPAIHASFSNHDCFAALVLLALGLCSGLLADYSWRRGVVFGAASIILTATLLMTQCRSAWLGAVVAGIVFAVLTVRESDGTNRALRAITPPLLALLILAIGGAALGVSSPLARLGALTVGSGEEFEVRRLVYTGSWTLVRQAPALGQGLDNFALAFQSVRPESWFTGYMNQAHTDPIQVLVETGVVGFLLLSAALLWVMRDLARVRGSSASIARGLLFALIGVAVYGFANFAIPVPADLIWMAACLGLSFGWTTHARGRQPASTAPRAWTTIVLAPILAIAAVWGAALGVGTFLTASLSRQAEAAKPRYQWDEAVRAMNAAVAWQPRNENLHLERGQLLVRVGQFRSDAAMVQAGLQDLDEALRLNPRGHGVRLTVAGVHGILGGREKAIAVLEGGVRDYPHNAIYWIELGRLYAGAGDSEQAARCFRESLRMQTDATQSLALALLGMEAQHGTGVARLSAWLRKRGPDHARLVDCALNAVNASSRLSPDVAQRFCAAILADDPHNEPALLASGKLLVASGKHKEAADHFTRQYDNAVAPAVRLLALRHLVECLITARKRDRAAQILERHLAANRWDNEARVMLVDIRIAEKNETAALRLLVEAVQTEPGNALLVARLGDLYAAQGMTELANQAYTDAMRLDPKNESYLQRMKALNEQL
ncbi:MAG: hypothetical protein FJX76_03270 [Armatimonadetes bacterium]|nr:hypothetical protein [Armatimonadota bacterium]